MPRVLDAFPEIVAALCVYREAGGEPYEGKLAVASTIRNRVHDKRWPDTLDEVVLQPWQFSSFNANDPTATKWPKRLKPAEWAAFVECCKAVEESTATDPTGGAVLYHATSIPAPYWAKKSTFIKQIGNHKFYK